MSKLRKKTRDMDYRHYRHPRWWPTWVSVGLMRLLATLPMKLQWRLGALLGELAFRTMKNRRHITETNIQLCFPELSDDERLTLVRKSFRSNGIGALEIGAAWFRDPEALKHLTSVSGLEHINMALAKGQGVLLLGGHYSTLDLGGSLVTLFIEADVMQRDHNNPLMNAVMTRARQRRYGVVLGNKDLRGLLKRLKANRIVWYATDQDYGRKGTVFAPFFNVPAASLTATARIAAHSGCAVIPFSHFRRESAIENAGESAGESAGERTDTKMVGYDLHFHPPLENFPSGDDLADATLINQTIEQEIRRHPDQYLWMHRRFKTRPSRNDPDFYRTTPT